LPERRTIVVLVVASVLICLVLVSAVLPYFVGPLGPIASSLQLGTFAQSLSYSNNINRATQYLSSHFSENVGLIYESEDSGTHWLRLSEFPSFSWSYQQTFWAYSDNLYASLALSPFNPSMAQEIATKIRAIPNVGEFLTVSGISVKEYREVQDVIIAQSPNFVILSRSYTGRIISPALNYADERMYYALSLYESGKNTEAKTQFQTAVNMWNGTCFVDAGVTSSFKGVGAPTDAGFCANNRLGLALFVGKVLAVPVPNSVNTILWSMQIANGGIASLSQHGTPIGTANAETTSLALIQFNDELIHNIQQANANLTSNTSSSSSSNGTQTAPNTDWSSYLAAFIIIAIASGYIVMKRRKD